MITLKLASERTPVPIVPASIKLFVSLRMSPPSDQLVFVHFNFKLRFI